MIEPLKRAGQAASSVIGVAAAQLALQLTSDLGIFAGFAPRSHVIRLQLNFGVLPQLASLRRLTGWTYIVSPLHRSAHALQNRPYRQFSGRPAPQADDRRSRAQQGRAAPGCGWPDRHRRL